MITRENRTLEALRLSKFAAIYLALIVANALWRRRCHVQRMAR